MRAVLYARSAAMRGKLQDRSSPDAKAFLRIFVDKIRVYAEEATISSAHLGMVEAAVVHRKGSEDATAVPAFIHKWRREWDSNPRYAFTYTRVPGVRLKPLGHLSVVWNAADYSRG